MKSNICDRCKSDSSKVRGMPKEFAEYHACDNCRSEIFQILEQYDESVRVFHEQGRRDAFYSWWVSHNPQVAATPIELITAHAASDYEIEVPDQITGNIMTAESPAIETIEAHPIVESTEASGGNG